MRELLTLRASPDFGARLDYRGGSRVTFCPRFPCRPRLSGRLSLALVAWLGALALALTGCTASCASYILTVTVVDQSTGNLLCDATVTFGVGDAGAVIDGSVAPSDAEVSPTSSVCQWDVATLGGNYTVTAKAPGFTAAIATVQLQADVCGTATVPVTVVLVPG